MSLPADTTIAGQAVYVTDTHSLVWYFTASPRLGAAARAAFDQVARGEARLIVPVIVMAELVWIIEHGRMQIDLDHFIHRLTANAAIEVAPLDLALVLAMRAMTVIPEMHDRLIACEAQRRRAKLISRDEDIRRAKVVETVW